MSDEDKVEIDDDIKNECESENQQLDFMPNHKFQELDPMTSHSEKVRQDSDNITVDSSSLPSDVDKTCEKYSETKLDSKVDDPTSVDISSQVPNKVLKADTDTNVETHVKNKEEDAIEYPSELDIEIINQTKDDTSLVIKGEKNCMAHVNDNYCEDEKKTNDGGEYGDHQPADHDTSMEDETTSNSMYSDENDGIRKDTTVDEVDDDLDDPYALLAQSKNRLDRVAEKNRSHEKFEDFPIETNDEESYDQNHEGPITNNDGDDSSHEGDEVDSIKSNSITHVDPIDSRNVENVSESISVNPSAVPTLTNAEIRKKKNEDTNSELWALLNYSKLRLATGGIPQNDAKENSQMEKEIDSVPLMDDEELDDDDHDTQGDEFKLDNEETHLNNRKKGDENTTSFDSDLSFSDEEEENHKETQNNWTDILNIDTDTNEDSVTCPNEDDARARAMAALAMVEEKELTEEQMLTSIVLAEEAAGKGENSFTTNSRISLLEKVQASFNSNPQNNMKKSSHSSFLNHNRRGIRQHSISKIDGSKKPKWIQRAGNYFRGVKETINKIDTMTAAQTNYI